MNELDLDTLHTGIPALTPIRAGFHREACVWCLLECGHYNSVKMKVIEKPSSNLSSYKIVWNEHEIDKSALYRAYNKNDGPEHGAVAIALLLIRERTDFTVVRRSVTHTGIDYWLGYKETVDNQLFKENARLEVSGSLSNKSLR